MKVNYALLIVSYLSILVFISVIWFNYDTIYILKSIELLRVLVFLSIIPLMLILYQDYKEMNGIITIKLLILQFTVISFACMFYSISQLSLEYIVHDFVVRSLYTSYNVLISSIPLILIIITHNYIKKNISIIDVLPSLYILVYSLSLGILQSNYDFYTINNFEFFTHSHPFFFNIVVLILANFAVFLQIIIPILEGNNYQLSNSHYIYLIGLILALIVSPILQLTNHLYTISIEYHLLNYQISQQTQIIGYILLSLTFIYNKNLYFNLIPQDIDRFIIMNEAGLPVFGYDFNENNDDLESNMMFSGSFEAIFQLIRVSIDITSIKSIDLSTGTLLIQVDKNLSYLFLVKNETKIVNSSFETFNLVFSQQIDIINKIKKRVNENLAREAFIRSKFETIFGLQKQEQNKISENDKKIIRSVVVLFLFFSIWRFTLFYYTTILIEFLSYGDLNLFTSILTLILLILIPIISYLKPISYRKSVLSLALIYPLVNLNNEFVHYFLSGIFIILGFLIFKHFLETDFAILSRSERFRAIIIAIILDLVFRSFNLGTDFVVLNDFIIKAIIALILIFSSQSFFKTESKTMQKKNYLFGIHMVYPILLTRFAMNPTVILSDSFTINLIAYFVLIIFYGLFLYLIMHHNLMNKILKSNYKYHLVLLSFYLLLSDHYPVFSHILSPLILISIVFLFCISLENKYTIMSRIKLVFGECITLIAIVLIFSLSNYGFTNLAMIFFILPLVNFKRDKIEIKKVKTNFNIFKNFSIFPVLFISSMLIISNSYVLNTQNNIDDIGIMSYNIQYGLSADSQYNPEKMAQYIIETGVSIVALQEITRYSPFNGNGDLLLQIQQVLYQNGFHYSVWMEIDGSILSNAIFSKLPITKYEILLFKDNLIYQKGILKTEISLANNKKIAIDNTHLTHIYSELGNNTRISQVNELIESYEITIPTILLGDFNIEPNSEPIDIVKTKFYDIWENEDTFTWPANKPNQRIDYIFTSNLNYTDKEIGLVRFSDHLPLIIWIDGNYF